MGLVSELRDSLEPFFLGEILGHHLAHVLKVVEAGVKQAKTSYCVTDEVVMQPLIAPESLECQLALSEGAEKRMALSVPAIANRENLGGYRSRRHMILVPGYSVLRHTLRRAYNLTAICFATFVPPCASEPYFISPPSFLFP